jgi:hypothetical protein
MGVKIEKRITRSKPRSIHPYRPASAVEFVPHHITHQIINMGQFQLLNTVQYV